MGLALGLSLGFGIPIALLIGAILGYYFAYKRIKKEIKDSPPINEKQIISMYKQMGRTPTDKQVKQIMASFKRNANK
ncbi:MAG: YneF family protein [Mycoplasmoidaceae bacterium]